MPDLVEGQVERGEARQVLEVADARDEVVVEVQVGERRGERGQPIDRLDGVLAEADARDLLEAVEAERGDGADAGLGEEDLVRVGGLAV